MRALIGLQHPAVHNLLLLSQHRLSPCSTLPCPLPPSDALAAVPLERWDVDGFAKVSPNALEARFGSFISGAQLFDAAALYMDPQQRLLLQHAAEALWARVGASPQAAGFKAGGGVSERTGVMIGIGPAEYVNQTSELLPMGMYFATGGAISVAAGRWVGGWLAGWLAGWALAERGCTQQYAATCFVAMSADSCSIACWSGACPLELNRKLLASRLPPPPPAAG